MVYKFVDKKSSSLDKSSGSGVDAEPIDQLANELHSQIIQKFKTREVYSFFIGNIWGADLGDMQSRNRAFIVCN